MRILRSLLLVLALWVLPLPLGGDRAVAIFTCGRFDGTFQCKATSGGVQHGKNASPSDTSTLEEAPQGTGEQQATAPAGNTTQGAQGGAREVVQPGEHSCLPPAIGFLSPLMRREAIASRRRGRRRLPTRGASTEWSARRLVVTAQRTRSCWAATASITPLPAAMASPPTSPRNPAREPTKSSPAKCVGTA